MQRRETQFDIWRSKKHLIKKSSIIADDDFPIHNKITNVFSEIIYLGKIETNSFNRKIKILIIFG